MDRTAITRACEALGTVSALAERLGISSQAISQWERVPAERVLQVEAATEGRVTRHELRPDIYPPEPVTPDPTPDPTRARVVAE